MGGRMVVQMLALAQWVVLSNAHGRLVEPPNRGSVWRLGYHVAKNYNDNSLNCGGFQVQWLVNGGRCGYCGDPYNGPRRHEKDGIYASDVITRTYMSGEVINVTVYITANHGGTFEFYLCPDARLSMSCFESFPLQVVGEGYRHKLTSWRSPLMERVMVKLPEDVSCPHCVLQWRWNCAQSFGMDWGTRRTFCKGCGRQEQFWNCADITIETPNANQESSREMSSSVPHRRSQQQNTTEPEPEAEPSDIEDADGKQQEYVRLPLATEAPRKRCVGSVTFGAILDAWCEVNCNAGFCPSTHCRCT